MGKIFSCVIRVPAARTASRTQPPGRKVRHGSRPVTNVWDNGRLWLREGTLGPKLVYEIGEAAWCQGST